MNTTLITETRNTTKEFQSLNRATLALSKEIRKQVQRAKVRICSEYRDLMDGLEHARSLALNEAEALAWETGFPQLVFPELAAEKVAAVSRWGQRQIAMQRTRREFAFAA